jgi:hypothetical protein
LIFIFIITIPKRSKSVLKFFLAILVCKAEICLKTTEQKFVILLHFIDRLTNINALSHRQYLGGRMSDDFTFLPHSRIMIALRIKFYLPSFFFDLFMNI